MKNLLLFIIITFALAGNAATDIVPLPQSIERRHGHFFHNGNLSFNAALPDSIRDVIATAAPFFSNAGIATSFSANPDVKIKIDCEMLPEAYTMDVKTSGITLSASGNAGIFYGLQTLLQLSSESLPAFTSASISDAPRFAWRGFMLDEARHFFGKEEVKRVLDIMAFHKLNRFHWHLTDDQGWRIEIPAYPRLTETGGTRSSRALAWGDAPTDSLGHSGFYTAADIAEIIDYADRRFIEIVPEIDMPGHTMAAIAAYPEILACDPAEEHKVWLSQGISDDVICVARPEARKMAADIIDALIEIFPSKFIHLGGDECPTAKWKKNPISQKRLRELKSDNAADLQIDFYKHLARHISRKPAAQQRRMIFWNEVLNADSTMLPTDAVIMAWVDADNQAHRAAARNHDVILSPQIPYYINRKQSPLPTEPMSQGRGTETLERVYSYIPPTDTDDALAKHCLGIQANFWTEWVATPGILEYLMLPRLAAVAEAAWTTQARRDYASFLGRLQGVRRHYDANAWNYANHAFDK